MILPIRLYTDSILHQACLPIEDFTGLEEFVQSMLITMEAYRGVGLAANQIGLSSQLCVLNLEEKTKKMALINPIIVCYTKETNVLEEGCLSCPGIYLKVKRSNEVVVDAQLLNGEKVKFTLTGFDARILQHEVDHLRGITIAQNLIKLI